jgi:hypothetical protein
VVKGVKSGSNTTSRCEAVLLDSQNATAAKIGMPGKIAYRIQIAIERKAEAIHIQPHQFFPTRQAIMALAIAAELVASANGSDKSLFCKERIEVLSKIEANVMRAIHQRSIVISIISHKDPAIRSKAAKFTNFTVSSGGLPLKLAAAAYRIDVPGGQCDCGVPDISR